MWFFRRKRPKHHTKHDPLAESIHSKSTHPVIHQEGVQMSHNGIRIERAVQQMLGAENWSMTKHIVEKEQEYLLTSEALVILDRYIHQMQHDQSPGALLLQTFLKAHRDLLEIAQKYDIDTAWEHFQKQYLEVEHDMASDHTHKAIGALRRFLSTTTWHETYTVLMQDQEYLLTDVAERFLDAMIHFLQQSSNSAVQEGVKYLQVHYQLLRDARQHGVTEAWEGFVSTMTQSTSPSASQGRSSMNYRATEINQITVALRTLLTTASWHETHTVLVSEQHILLTETCERIFEDVIKATKQEHSEGTARNIVYLTMHLRLIQLAREKGIEEAWQSFVTAMNLKTEQDAIAPSKEEDPIPMLDEPLRRIRDAVNEFLDATSWDAAFVILENQKDDLFSDVAVALISARADQLQASGSGRDIYAANILHREAVLLRRAREIGLDEAWKEFRKEIS